MTINLTRLSRNELEELRGRLACSNAPKEKIDKAIAEINAEIENRLEIPVVEMSEVKAGEFQVG